MQPISHSCPQTIGQRARHANEIHLGQENFYDNHPENSSLQDPQRKCIGKQTEHQEKMKFEAAALLQFG